MVGGRDVVIPSFLRDIHDSISMNHLRRVWVFLYLSNYPEHGNHLLQPAFSSDTLLFDSRHCTW